MKKKALVGEDFIMLPPNIGVITIMRKRKGKSKVKELVGMIREHKDKYSSVELQHKSKEFWRDVSD